MYNNAAEDLHVDEQVLVSTMSVPGGVRVDLSHVHCDWLIWQVGGLCRKKQNSLSSSLLFAFHVLFELYMLDYLSKS